MNKSFFILLPLCFCSLWVTAQSRGFTSYSVEDGLAQTNVVDIAEDRFGNLWLATFGGLSKFNGLSFETFDKQDGLSSNRIFCLTVDANGHIWVGTNLGVSEYDGRTFINYPIEGLTSNQWVSRIQADKEGRIWFATTAGGISTVLPGPGTMNFNQDPWLAESSVSGIVEVAGEIWISTYNQGIYRYQNSDFTKVVLSEELESGELSAIFADGRDRIWLGTSIGLYQWNGEEFQWMHSFHQESLDFVIYSISEEMDGTIWLGTTNGAFKYQKGICTAVKAQDGLTDNIIYKIHRDREGTLWFGSFGGGLFKSLGEIFTHIGKGHGMSYDYISSITRDATGDYWFGSYGGGIYHYAPQQNLGSSYTIQNFNQEKGLSNNFVFGTQIDDQGNLWIATAWGLNMYDGKRFINYYQQQGLPSNQVYSLLKASDGRLFCGTANGLSLIDVRGQTKFRNYQHQGDIQHNRVRTLLEMDDGQILLGTLGGLKVFKGSGIEDYFSVDSLNSRPISSLYQDKNGGLWCGLVDDGIMFYQPGTSEMFHYTEDQGLSSNIVYSLAVDHQGALWVGTPRGLDKVTFDQAGQILTVRNFAANEGFFGIETNTNAILLEEDGSIWFGTVAGAYKCNPEQDQVNTLEPITFLTGIRLFSQQVDWSGISDSTYGWFNIPTNLRLSHAQNHITFQFLGNSLKNPQKVRYQFKLVNFDRNWQPVTNKNEAVYTNLPPGNYVFQVKASNNDGIWNQEAASFSFEIKPPFWRTWWFFTLMFIILSIAGRLYYNFRIHKKLNILLHVEKIKNEETIKVRKRVAEDFHDQVGNQLASITVLVQLIQAKMSRGNQEAEELLKKLGQFTKTLFTGTRDFIWSIDPKSDNVNEMLIYIRDFGEELFEYSGINFYVDTNDTFNTNIRLPVGWSRHVVFIFKEALTNSLKHANCKNVYLNFNVEDHYFVFELKDDGKGLNGYIESDNFGMGLQNMRERAKKISSKISITSQNGKGTKVILEGKIPYNAG